ncbi:H-NS histone family protein [Delftia sp. CH05]|uniref:H-NS histone family protein n=1 Tax=Delftia sp. CH05 TaxID=2692194 RepID=UPI00301CCE85
MNLKELLAAKAALDAEIAVARKSESTEALRRVHQLVNEFGFTSQHVFPLVGLKAKNKGEAKYRNPETDATWTGRGKPPAWILDKNRDDFLIAQPEPEAGDRAPYLAEMAAAAGRNQASR